ncbi:MAG: winged helix-turn-helix domain-containing protein [Pseudomonadota bacterium]
MSRSISHSGPVGAFAPSGPGHQYKGCDVLSVGRWRLDAAAREATDGALTCRLSPRAMQVLLCLAEAGGAVVARSALIEAVWPDVHVSDESLTQAVAELRRTLGDGSRSGGLVETVPKSGYRLIAQVLRDASAPGRSGASGPKDEDTALRSVEAHVQITEAYRLAQFRGVLAAGEIDVLVREARAMAPRSASVLSDYAVLLALAGIHAGQGSVRIAEAGEAAEQAVALRPDLVAAHRALGFAAGAARGLAPALNSLALALTIDPQDRETHYLAAQVCFAGGDLRKAMVLGERAAELAPGDYRPAYNAARAALHLGEMARAERLTCAALKRIGETLALDPDNRRFQSARAAASAMLGQGEPVETTLDRAKDAPLFYDVVALAHQGAIDLACNLFETLVEQGWRHTGWVLADPVQGLLQRERRFCRLVDRMAA